MNYAMEIVGSSAEKINEEIHEHASRVRSWEYADVVRKLTKLYDALNESYFERCLPRAVIAIGDDLIKRYAYYQLGRDSIGALHRIHMNARHLGRSQSDVGVTLLHEMIHMYQDLHGLTSSRARHHNSHFISLAKTLGIEAEYGSGVTLGVKSHLRLFLETCGFSPHFPMVDGIEAIPKSRPKRKEALRCMCGQTIWVNKDESVLALCEACHTAFSRDAFEQRLAVPPMAEAA